MAINKYNFLYKKLIIFSTKNTKTLLFLVKWMFKKVQQSQPPSMHPNLFLLFTNLSLVQGGHKM